MEYATVTHEAHIDTCARDDARARARNATRSAAAASRRRLPRLGPLSERLTRARAPSRRPPRRARADGAAGRQGGARGRGGAADGALVSHWVGDQIALWHRDTGEMEVLYNLYDIFDPWSYPPTSPSRTCLSARARARPPPALRPLSESRAETFSSSVRSRQGTRWSISTAPTLAACRRSTGCTRSSIPVGPDGSYYAALRNVNTILCLGRDGEGLKWSLSPTLRSNFTFASAADHFYNPPRARSRDAAAAKRRLMLDDGNNRANCSQITPARTCRHSRAIEMHLDFETMVARVAWQFEFLKTRGQPRARGQRVDGTNRHAAALTTGESRRPTRSRATTCPSSSGETCSSSTAATCCRSATTARSSRSRADDGAAAMPRRRS